MLMIMIALVQGRSNWLYEWYKIKITYIVNGQSFLAMRLWIMAIFLCHNFPSSLISESKALITSPSICTAYDWIWKPHTIRILCENSLVRFDRFSDSDLVLCTHAKLVLLPRFKAFDNVRLSGWSARYWLPKVWAFFAFLHFVTCKIWTSYLSFHNTSWSTLSAEFHCRLNIRARHILSLYAIAITLTSLNIKYFPSKNYTIIQDSRQFWQNLAIIPFIIFTTELLADSKFLGTKIL